MKKGIYAILAIGALFFTACNNGNGKNEHEGHDMSSMGKETMQHVTQKDTSEAKIIPVTFTTVDVNAAASIKEIVDHYLHIKNALTNDNASEAANGGKAMEAVMSKMDKSLLTAEQKKVFDDIADDLKEHAEHIAKNGDKIKQQRDHFSMMSEDVYDLAKAFGGGRTLYHDHCPMAKNNQGAMWMSEIKEVKNPYFGSEMLTCGTVEEIIK
jgi:predicted small secreted protein